MDDIFVIGGGINGCAIARDAAGRGLKVTLAEMNDLGSATSSASTKLFHGGLRYLEFFEFDLVKHSLVERETLLRAMPHISWPMRFVLPYHKDMRFDTTTPASRLMTTFMPWLKGRRPAWMIRLGLFLYDSLGGRKILPRTKSLNLRRDPAGAPLKDKFKRAYEYSDCWVDDARLVVLNARDAEARGAQILTRTKVTDAKRLDDHWVITTRDVETGEDRVHTARIVINAGGPWVEEILTAKLRLNATEGVRLVRGSHIVTKKLYDHDKCYFFQGEDGRIIFAIPYEDEFTLIGTTDQDHGRDPARAAIATGEEQDYLCAFASEYFERPVTREDVVWTYSGVRPLYDDGATSATAATRDYVLSLDTQGPALLSVFGGKITTNRVLAEDALAKMSEVLDLKAPWTAKATLPGGDFPVDGVGALVGELMDAHPSLDRAHAHRLVRTYGTEAKALLGNGDLGRDFGATLTEREVCWLMDHEYARNADDVAWRRTKLGLRMRSEELQALEIWMRERRAAATREDAS